MSGQGATDAYRSQWPYIENMKFLEGNISLRSQWEISCRHLLHRNPRRRKKKILR
jgi:hypothetical protein